MAEQAPQSTDPLPTEPIKFDPATFNSLAKEDPLATVSWYLVATGIAALIFAAICLYLDRTGTEFFTHKDFALNPKALARYLLLAGLFFYASGRSITYYRRYKKRS